MNDQQIKHIVDRFLGWKLPQNFNPDDGISFDPISNRGHAFERRREPSGTNLFDADQAETMVRYITEGLPEAKPDSEFGWVIEHGASEVSRPRYWGGVHGWTYDNLKAVRFAREDDARAQAEAMDDGTPNNYRIAEHAWG